MTIGPTPPPRTSRWYDEPLTPEESAELDVVQAMADRYWPREEWLVHVNAGPGFLPPLNGAVIVGLDWRDCNACEGVIDAI